MSDQKHATVAPNQTAEGAAPPSELARLIQQPRRELDLIDNAQFGAALALAQQLSTAAGFVPKHLLGNPGACLGVVSLADAWRVNPFLLAASCSDVHGKLCWEAKAVQAGIERSGVLAGRLAFAFVGDWAKVRGKFTMRDGRQAGDDGRPKQYAVPGWQPADEEGLAVDVTGTPAGSAEPVTVRCYLKACQPRNSTLWATDPETQCRYRATRNWARLVTPAVMMGAVTPDEYEPLAEPPPAPAAEATATPPAALAIVRTRKRAATPAEGAQDAARDAANATAAPPAANPDAPRPTPADALAAVEKAGCERGLFIRWLKGTSRWPEQGLDGLSAELCGYCVQKPAAVARDVSKYVDADDAAREEERKIMGGAGQKQEG